VQFCRARPAAGPVKSSSPPASGLAKVTPEGEPDAWLPTPPVRKFLYNICTATIRLLKSPICFLLGFSQESSSTFGLGPLSRAA